MVAENKFEIKFSPKIQNGRFNMADIFLKIF